MAACGARNTGKNVRRVAGLALVLGLSAGQGPLLAGLQPARAADQAAVAAGFEDRPEWPDTPLATLARELLEIINAGDRARAAEFVRQHYDLDAWQDMPPPALAGWLAGVRQAHQRLDFVAVRTTPGRSSDREIVAILRSAARESYVGLALTRGEGSDKIVGMVIMPAREPRLAGAAEEPLTVAGLGSELDGYLRRMAAADQFSGSVLVARHGEVLFEKAYGPASRSYAVPNTPATRFSLASMGKMFTAVAIMRLVEQGRLALDDTLDRRLPEGWLAPGVADRITIRHLLTHTSGLGDFMERDAFWHGSRLDYRITDDYRPLFTDMQPDFVPGTSWTYSNAGYLLLGAVIEAVTGLPYHRFVAEAVWQPAGMTDTALLDLDRPYPELAEGYFRDTEGAADGAAGEADPPLLRSNTMLRSVRGTAAGGAYATSRDLLRFDRALRSGRLLTAESLEWIWTATEASRRRMPYGAGFTIKERPGDRRVGHGGTFPGVTTSLEMHLDTGWTVVVLCNLTGGVGAMDLNQRISDLIARVEAADGGTPDQGPGSGTPPVSDKMQADGP